MRASVLELRSSDLTVSPSFFGGYEILTINFQSDLLHVFMIMMSLHEGDVYNQTNIMLQLTA